MSLVTTAPAKLVTLNAGSLAQLVQQRKAQRTTFLLLDASWSMSHPAGLMGGRSKMDALRMVVQELNNSGVRPRMVGFGLTHSKGPEAVGFVEYVPEAVGSTPLAEGINYAGQFGAQHLIVVSDGAPDDPQGALDAARMFPGPIDVFYVGTRPNPGEDFLRQLAAASGGSCQSVSLAQPAALTLGLKRMLTA